MADPVVRLTVNVSPEIARTLENLANTMKTSKTQAINQAIATTAAMYKAEAEGGKLVVTNGSKQRPVNLPRA